jgi:hypothetical protein
MLGGHSVVSRTTGAEEDTPRQVQDGVAHGVGRPAGDLFSLTWQAAQAVGLPETRYSR